MQLLDGAPASATDLQPLALTGFGHFTTMRVERGGVRGLARHLARLARDCRTVFRVELDIATVRDQLRAAIADEPDPVVVRVTVFDPRLGVERPGAEARPRVLMTPRLAAPARPPALRVRTVRFARELPAVKHTGLFGALLARAEAQRDGWDDAVFADDAGRLAEGPTWNLGFVRDGGVVWPAADTLPGVTAALLDDALRAQSVPSSTAAVTPADLPRMDAAFATNAGFGVRPIASIDGVAWDPAHPALERLETAYLGIPLKQV